MRVNNKPLQRRKSKQKCGGYKVVKTQGQEMYCQCKNKIHLAGTAMKTNVAKEKCNKRG